MTSLTIDSSEEKGEFQEKKVIFLWSITVWLVVMNTTMFNVALPTVLLELSLTSAIVSWIVSGYSIFFAIAALTFSRLSDFVPISRLLVIALTIVTIASIIGFFSTNFYTLLTARVLQATGAGAVPGLGMVLVGRYIPIERRGKAMAYIASAASLGFGLGPVIGGAVTQYLGWNYLFIITSVVILFVPIFIKLLPIEEGKQGRFDLLGALLTALTVTGLLLFFTTFSIWLLAVTIFLMISVWYHIHRSDIPFLQPHLLKNKPYLLLVFISFSSFVTHFSILFLMPLILSIVFMQDAAKVGLIIFPGAILSAIAAQFIGRFIDRYGNMPVIFCGQLFLFIASLLYAFTSTIHPAFILVTYMFVSTGFSAITSSVSNEISRILSAENIGAGMGMAQLSQFFGGAFGVTVAGVLITLQSGLPETSIYRNIFLCITGVITTAILAFFLYYNSRKKML